MSSSSKYIQIENYFIDKIRHGELKDGDRLETEKELCKKFGVSRMTINKALSNLSLKGYVNRISGNGTYVSNHAIVKNIKDKGISFSEEILKSGEKPGSKLIEYRVFRAGENPDIQKLLKLSDNDMIHYFVRLKTGDNRPIAIIYTYVSATVLPAIDVNVLTESFDDFVSKNGIAREKYYSEITACLPTDDQKKILGISNVALLKQTVLWYVKNDIPFEMTELYQIGDRYKYVIS